MAQSVKHLTLTQVMISPSVSLSPAPGSVLTAQSLEEPASDSVSPSLSAPPPLMLGLSVSPSLSKINIRGAWVAQSVECPTSVQVMISLSVSLSPMLGSVLTAQSLEPALESVSPSLPAPPPLMLCLSFSQKQINIIYIYFFLKKEKLKV